MMKNNDTLRLTFLFAEAHCRKSNSMRHLLIALLAMAGLVATVTGCGGRGVDRDRRLVAADSLMMSRPDSALTLVEALCRDSLRGEGDRAYRDLLLTQARYRCYVTATSDSDINRALDYYRRHDGERDKLTRAYLYKGAVMEELGHPDSAMLYYKHAAATAAPDDYFNLGYANLRIAELYQYHFTNDSAVVARLKRASRHFAALKDTAFLVITTGTQGEFTKILGKDSSRIYLNAAIALAQKIDSKKGLQYQSKLSGTYFYDGDYVQAKNLAMDIFKNGREYCDESQFYYYAARSFIRLGDLDSARWLISMIPPPSGAVDSMNHYQTLAELADATSRHRQYVQYSETAKRIASRILESNRNSGLQRTELAWDANEQGRQMRGVANRRVLLSIVLSLLAIAAVLAVSARLLRSRATRYRHEMNKARVELETLLASNEADARRLDAERKHYKDLLAAQEGKLEEAGKINRELRSRLSGTGEQASEIVKHRLSAINGLYREIKVKTVAEDGSKRVMPLMSVLKEMLGNKWTVQSLASESFWNELRLSVDEEFPGLVSRVKRNHPDLTEKESRLFLLMCADLPNPVIKLCMSYKNDTTASKNKGKLIQKICPGQTLQEFIQSCLHDGQYA